MPRCPFGLARSCFTRFRADVVCFRRSYLVSRHVPQEKLVLARLQGGDATASLIDLPTTMHSPSAVDENSLCLKDLVLRWTATWHIACSSFTHALPSKHKANMQTRNKTKMNKKRKKAKKVEGKKIKRHKAGAAHTLFVNNHIKTLSA